MNSNIHMYIYYAIFTYIYIYIFLYYTLHVYICYIYYYVRPSAVYMTMAWPLRLRAMPCLGRFWHLRLRESNP